MFSYYYKILHIVLLIRDWLLISLVYYSKVFPIVIHKKLSELFKVNAVFIFTAL